MKSISDIKFWSSCWLAKIDYDLGFCEWLFRDKKNSEIFTGLLPLVKRIQGFGIYNNEEHNMAKKAYLTYG